VTAAGAGNPRVVLVDDHELFRAGVRSELDGLVDVVGDAATVAEAVAMIHELAPDVVLLDVHMPDGGGLEVIRRLRAAGTDAVPAHPRFLALSVSDAAEDVIAVIRAGARGYVTKTISGADLADAVRRVHGGDAVFSPRLAGFVLDAFASAGGPAGAGGAIGREPHVPVAGHDAELDQLTPREREVLQHIARGYMYKEIALRLGISAKTVEAHVSAVLRKLQLSNRHELSRWASERRLLD
jgi:DNA-binding NarL/FixJ family response regulator